MKDWSKVDTVEVIRAILNGHESAWHAFQDRYARWVYGISIHCFKRSPEEAQDDYQNVVLKLLSNDCK